MKLLFAIMAFIALSLVNSERTIYNKCSLDYLHKIVEESCETSRAEKLLKRRIARNVPHRFGGPRSNKLNGFPPIEIDMSKIPPNGIITIKRRRKLQKRHNKDNNDGDVSDYFYIEYCCKHIEQCEEMDCPD